MTSSPKVEPRFQISNLVTFQDSDGYNFYGEVFERHREPDGYSYSVKFYDYMILQYVTRIIREDDLRPDDFSPMS